MPPDSLGYFELKVFLGDPAVSLDTNNLEGVLRVIPMGRRNYLFCWIEVGVDRIRLFYGLEVLAH